MDICNNYYSLYELSSFTFADSTVAPTIGIKTKNSGTIYPLQYDVIRDSEIGKMPVVFGF